MRRSLALALTAATALAGCGDEGGDAAGTSGGGISVAATTTQVADFARQVSGDDRVRLEALVPPNADPHDYEPRPSDARAIAESEVILRSGGDLDGWLGDLVDSAGSDARRVTLIDAVDTITGDDGGEPDPHWWQDPRNAVMAVERIRDAFVEADPEGRAEYERNAARYIERIRALDAAIARCMASIPEDRRELVTNHDAFGYFAARYDVAVVGAISPGLSTAAQPSAGDVRRLVAEVRANDVRVIFPETALDQRLERAIAEEAGARVGPALYADTLGPGDSEGATYLGALRHDAAAMIEGFGGRCRLPAVR